MNFKLMAKDKADLTFPKEKTNYNYLLITKIIFLNLKTTL